MISHTKQERLVLVIKDIPTYIFRSFSSHVEVNHCWYGLQWKQELALKYTDVELLEDTHTDIHTQFLKLQSYTHFLFTHFGKFIKKGKVFCEMFTVWLNAMLHNRQESLHKTCHTRATADVFHRTIHVIRTENRNQVRRFTQCMEHTFTSV